MALTSEQVHWLGGTAFIVVSLALILYETGLWRARALPWLLPLLLVGYGIESFADLWVHGAAAPLDYGPESQQHLLQGTAVTIAGVIEALRLRGRVTHALWGLAVPLALLVVAAVFWLHAQHDADVSPMLMMVQHRAFAVTLAAAALARSLALARAPAVARFSSAWLLALLIFGVQLVLYTEPAAMSHMGH